MKKNTIAILGCGWLGTAAAKLLTEQGYRVYGSTTTSVRLSELEAAGIRPFKIDLGNPDQKFPEEFMHAETLIISLTPRALADNAQSLTFAWKENKPNHIIYISSTAVYPNNNRLVTEKDAVHQKSPHSGLDMLALEEQISEFAPTTVLRPGGLYGPDRHPGRFLSGKSGIKNGTAPVNLVHQEDISRAIQTFVVHKKSGIYNVVAPEHPERQEFYTKAAAAAGLPLPEFSKDSGDNSYKIVDSGKLIKDLGFTFLHPDPLRDL